MKPFQRAHNDMTSMPPAAQAVAEMIDHEPPKEVWKNDRYTVAVWELDAIPGWPKMYHLSIKLNNRAPLHDWRDLQLIKNMIIGPEHEGFELYPAESRLVDTANQYHLFVCADDSVRLPVGFRMRLVSEGTDGSSKQRDFKDDERPDDCERVTAGTFEKWAKDHLERARRADESGD